MRLLFTTDYYHPHAGGGTEVVVRRLAEGLAARGHEIHVATLNTRAADAYSVVGGVQVHRFPTVDATRLLRTQLTVSPQFVRAFGRLLDLVRPDLVNAHNAFFSTSPIALHAARRRGIRTVLTAHLNSPSGLPFPLSVVARGYEALVGTLTAGAADQVVAVGKSVSRHAQRVWRLKNPPTVIPNGVDSELFAPGTDRPDVPLVLFVGRLFPNKGPRVFVDAARQLRGRGVEADFWLAGDGPLRHELELVAEDDPRIRLLGERDDVPSLMRRATILARPSTLEGLPLTVLEAMSSAVPVVATAIPGNVDLVEHGRTGLLCMPGSAESLAAQLAVLLGDRQLAADMGRRARQRVIKDYTWESVVGAFERLALAA